MSRTPAIRLTRAGWAFALSACVPPSPRRRRATLWDGQRTIDIVGALSAEVRAAGWRLFEARASNDAGFIAASAFNVDTQEFQAFLITTSVPEPHTWALMALGLGGLAWRRRAGFGVQYGDGQPTRR